MPQREIRVTPSQFGWLVLALVFTGTTVVQIYLFFSTAATWSAWAAIVLGLLAVSSFRISALHAEPASSRLDITSGKSKESAG